MAHAFRWSPTPPCVVRRARLSYLALSCGLIAAGLFVSSGLAADPSPTIRDLNSHCPFHPPTSIGEWETRSIQVREQLEVSLGMSPEPILDPVAPEIYGRIEGDGFSVEKVTFDSLPGLKVTGNLYRPLLNEPAGAKSLPAVLCPHGHWREARFYDEDPKTIAKSLATGAERFENAARNHIQARCVQLARMGCVVFHWDMLGYCDSQQIPSERAHGFREQAMDTNASDGWPLFSGQAELQLQSVMALQTLATHRAVDFVLTLDEVDPARVAISGASGGGTQSFVGAALDSRIQVAFPAVMVSTGMQGGCTCENACGLRTGTGNVEVAALIAPRPLGLTAADDWTKTMPNDGFPELQRLYQLYDAGDRVSLFPALHFGHNYNHVSRTSFYTWLNQQFDLGYASPVLERDFDWLGKAELSVWDEEHPMPHSGREFEEELMKLWAEMTDQQMRGMLQGDQQQRRELLETIKKGWRVCLGLTTLRDLRPSPAVERDADVVRFAAIAHLPAWDILRGDVPTEESGSFWASTPDASQPKPAYQPYSPTSDSLKIRVVNPEGKPVVYSPLLWGTRVANNSSTWQLERPRLQARVENPRLAAAYTYCYNLPLFSQSALQLGITLQSLRATYPRATLHVTGTGEDAVLAIAGVFCYQSITNESQQVELDVDVSDFRFGDYSDFRDPRFVPGAARYWDVPGLVSCLQGAVQLAAQEPTHFEWLAPIQRLSKTSISWQE